eukprot:gene5726-6310_t
MPKSYPLVEEASRHCWSNNFLEIFRDFYAKNVDLFMEAPLQISGEQNLAYYALYQEYLKLYERELQKYIDSLGASSTEFYRELAEVKDDPQIQDKKLLYFVDYLVACTDYESFYKVMVRAAKKKRKEEFKTADTFSESKTSSGDFPADSKSEVKENDHKGHK